jgi:hypothetical protein
MHRRASALFLGLFVVSAAMQGAAACSNSPATNQEDSGAVVPEDSSAEPDAGPPVNPLCLGASGPVPVMTVLGPDGGEIEPDWSCYDAGVAFLFRPRPLDTDGGDDAGDATVDSPVDSAPPFDSAPPVDAAPPPVDSSVPPDSSTPEDAGNDYVLQLTDFVSGTPPVGATVDIIWGISSFAPGSSPPVAATPNFTGQIDNAGQLLFPAPPAGQKLLTYHVSNRLADAGQAPLYWLGAVIVPPPGQTTYNSLSLSSQHELLLSVLGSESPAANLALIVAGATDCQQRDLQGAQFQVVDSATGQPVVTTTNGAPGSPISFYLQQNLPNPACTYTSNRGGRAVWTMVNGPVTAGSPTQYTLQFSGRMSASQPAPVLIDTFPVESYPGATTLQRSGRLNATPPN